MTRPIPIRMSSAGKCPKQQYLAAYQVPESDPPDRQSENRMALGDAAENILIRNMIKDGWEVTDTRAVEGGEQIELEIDQPLPMTGHPDGICRHPEYTRGKWVTLECKSMSDEKLQEVKRDGIAAVYPEYLDQVACYSRALYEQNRVVHPHRAVFAYMSRDGDNPPQERIAWTATQESALWKTLRKTWNMILQGREPERPYLPDDKRCQYCPYYTMCQGQDPPTSWEMPSVNRDPELVAAAERWLQADSIRRDARDAIIEAAPDPYGKGIEVGPLRASWFWPKETDAYDPEKLEKLVPMDVLRRCLNPNAKGPAFWIRPTKR